MGDGHRFHQDQKRRGTSRGDCGKTKTSLEIGDIPCYDQRRKVNFRVKYMKTQLPIFVEKDASGFYVVECPLFEGCYSQGKTLDDALKNIREVIQMVLTEKRNKDIMRAYQPSELSLHTIML